MTSTSPEPATTRREVVSTLYASQLVSAVGDGSFYVTSALYFSELLGLSATQIGVVLTAAWALGFASTAPIGHLGDRLGLRGGAVALSVVTALALGSLTLASSVATCAAVMTVYAVAQSGAGAVRQALLVRLVAPSDRVVVRARLQSLVNAGIAAGAGLGGIALYIGEYAAYAGVFVFDAATFGIAAVMLTRLPKLRPAPRVVEARAPVLRDRPYVAATALNAVLYLYMPMLSVVLPLYIAQRTGAPGWMVAALFVLNTGGVLLLQLPAARAVAGLLGAAASVRRGGYALSASCLAFWVASLPESSLLACAALVAAIGLQVAGEVCVAAGSWEIGFGLADPRRPGQWQGMYAGAIPVARALGPIALTALVLDGPGWPALGGVFLVASLAMTPVVRWGRRRRTGDVLDARVPAPAQVGQPMNDPAGRVGMRDDAE